MNKDININHIKNNITLGRHNNHNTNFSNNNQTKNNNYYNNNKNGTNAYIRYSFK